MASRRGDELAPFVLANVEGLKKDSQEAGHGAYGVIYNVTVNGLQYVAKRLHKALVEQVRNSEEIKQKFRNECITLSRLKHPNIVHFIGVHYGKDRSDLTLIMECLPSDLSSFLETHPQIPLPLKLAILLDVTYGLLYLHTHNPPIVHRDLTDRNILITSDGRAKLADLGMAKLLTPQALMAINKHTKVPGRLWYMPPETLTENPECTPKIDVFSFGHLSLFTINEEDPQVFEIIDVPIATKKQGGIQVLKRRPSVEKVGQDHCMYPLITRCLHDNPNQRPETAELTENMQELCTRHPLTTEIADVVSLCKGNMIMIAEEEHIAMQEQQDSLQKELSSVRSELETVTLYKDTIEKELVPIKEEAFHAAAENEELRAKVVQFAESLEAKNELQRDVHKLENEKAELIDQLEASQTQYTQQIDRLANELESAVTDRDMFRGALTETDSKYQHQISALLVDNADSNKTVASLKRQIAKLQEFQEAQKSQFMQGVQELTAELEAVCEHSRKLSQKTLNLRQQDNASKSDDVTLAATVDSQSDKEKDRQIRSLQRRLEHAELLETRVTQLTIELSQKYEEIDQLKKTKKGGSKGHVQEPMSQHRIQELSAELDKWREHSKSQSRKVLNLKQELEGKEIEFEERIQSMEGIQEDLEREKKQLFDQARALRAERDELQRTKGQLEKENLVMKQQEVRTMQKSQLLEAQLDETNCPKHGCKELRKKYCTLAAENAQLQQTLTPLSRISEQLSAREEMVREQKKTIAELMKKVEIAQTQASSDFEEERKDRMEAHSKFADLEMQAAKTKSHFDQERAAYEQHVLNLQQDLSAVKTQLKSHAQELVHMTEYAKRQGKLVKELTEKKNKLEKELAKRKDPKAGKVMDTTFKQLKMENDRLKTQLSEARKSIAAMSEAMKNKKGKKKVSEEVTKHLKRFQRLVAKASGESMEFKLTEAQTLIEMLCRTNDELEEKVHALTVANDEMTKMVSNTVPKITKQRSFDRSHNYTEGSQPSSLSENMCSSFSDPYNEGCSRIEEYTTGTGRTATGPKQASMTTTSHFPSTFATQEDQLSPLPPSGAHPSTGVRNLKGEYRQSSAPAVNAGMNFPSSQNQPQTFSAKDKSHLGLQRFHSNPGPQGSGNTGTRELPVRGFAPPPTVTGQGGSVPQKQPIRAVGPAPPSISNQGVPNIHQPSPLAGQGHQQTDTTVPHLAVQQQQQQYGNQLTTPGMKLPPKMCSAEQRREREQDVYPRPSAHHQPDQKLMSSQAVAGLHERRSSGTLLSNIDDDIEQFAAKVRDEVSSGRERTIINTDRPYDPDLVCPMCNKKFRIGEIQKFRHHVNQCEGKK